MEIKPQKPFGPGPNLTPKGVFHETPDSEAGLAVGACRGVCIRRRERILPHLLAAGAPLLYPVLRLLSMTGGGLLQHGFYKWRPRTVA